MLPRYMSLYGVTRPQYGVNMRDLFEEKQIFNNCYRYVVLPYQHSTYIQISFVSLNLINNPPQILIGIKNI